MKLRDLKDKIAHKDHHDADQDAGREDDNAFLHMTSKDTGAAETHDQRETKGKGVY